jgi:hypothetical protein
MRRLLPIGAVAVGVALVALVASALTGGGGDHRPAARADGTLTARDGGYTIAAPRGWKKVAEGPAATVLRRDDKRGVVVIRRRPAVAGNLRDVGRRLAVSLRRRLPDYQPAGARITTVRGSDRLVHTFVRPKANQVQSIVVAPAGDRTYTLDLVADGDAPEVARELGRMVTSFAPAS